MCYKKSRRNCGTFTQDCGLLLNFPISCGNRKKGAWNKEYYVIHLFFFSRTELGGDYRKKILVLSLQQGRGTVYTSETLVCALRNFLRESLLLNKTRLWVTRLDRINVSKIYLASQIILVHGKMVLYSERMQMRKLF